MTTAAAERKRVTGKTVRSIDGLDPLGAVGWLSGVRVYDVGQGDCIAVLDENGEPVLQIDYGGRQGNPYPRNEPKTVDHALPVDPTNELVMLTHWDEDHWCTARRADQVTQAKWLVPRQVTSPRAVRFSVSLSQIACIPEDRVGEVQRFVTAHGDEIYWEKIGKSATDLSKHEDCNRTGVGFSVVRRSSEGDPQVILLPGDSPYDRIVHYLELCNEGLSLRGLVASHHGARTLWTQTGRSRLQQWSDALSTPVDIVFSHSDPNTYDHPFEEEYEAIFLEKANYHRTSSCRSRGTGGFIDIVFR